MPDSSTQVATAYNGLKAAYGQAYQEADGLDTANRELVHHVLAGSSEAVANRLVTRGADQALVEDARQFAAAAASEDHITTGAAIAKAAGDVLLPAGLLGLGVGVVVFAVGLFTDIWQSSQEVGAGVAQLLLSGGITGGLVVVIARLIGAGAQAAPAAGSGIAEALREAFASTDPAKKVLARVYAAERVFFGKAPLTSQKLVIAGTGPALAGLLTLLLAIPAVMLAGGLTGAFSGADNPYDTTPNFPTGPTGPP